jgi:polysaccharide biosynthesis protein PelG
MAGIGFSLQRLMTQDRLSSQFRGYLHATTVAAGPWLLTAAAIAMMVWLAKDQIGDLAQVRFGGVALLAFSVSLVIASPAALVLSRTLADAIYERDVRTATPRLLHALAWVLVVTAPVALVLFGAWMTLPLPQRVFGFLLSMVCSGVWVTSAVLAAMRSFSTVTWAFVAGLLLALATAYFGFDAYRGTSLLIGLTAGLSLTLFILLARAMSEFPSDARTADWAASMGADLLRHRGLALAGLFYALALWVDEWIMTQAAGALSAGRGVRSHPVYEGAMFLASVAVVPTMVMLLVSLETRWHDGYRAYHREVMHHGTLRSVRRQHGALMRLSHSAFKRIVLVQVAALVLALLAAPTVLRWMGGPESMLPVLRFGLVGAGFHGVLIALLTALAYFDRQRWMLAACLTFFVANAALTYVCMVLGPAYHGVGYAIAAMLACLVAFVGASGTMARLPYVTFVAANSAVRHPQQALRAAAH